MNENFAYILYLIASGILSFFIGQKFKHLSWGPYLLIGALVCTLFAFGWLLVSLVL